MAFRASQQDSFQNDTHRQADPYKVLNLNPRATTEEIDRAFYYISQMYHPDKGGNEEQYFMFQQAYQTIMASRSGGRHAHMQPRAPSSWDDMRQGSRKGIETDYRHKLEEFQSADRGFNSTSFNQKFAEQAGNGGNGGNSYTYNVDYLQAKDRDAQSFRQQYSQITTEAESVTPMFSADQFNNETFNQVFSHMKKQHEKHNGQDLPSEPEPLAAYGATPYTRLDDPQGQRFQNQYEQAYKGTHVNPTEYNGGFIGQFESLPDITKVNRMSASEAASRIGQYQSTQLQYNKDALITDRTTMLANVAGLDSTRSQHSTDLQHQRIMNQPITIATPGLLPLDRPMPTNGSYYRETAGYVPDSPALLLNPLGTPPPVYRRKAALPNDVKVLKKIIRQQQQELRGRP